MKLHIPLRRTLRSAALLCGAALLLGPGLPAASQGGGAERLLELQRQERARQSQQLKRRGQRLNTRQDRIIRRRSTLDDPDRPLHTRFNRFGRYGNVMVDRPKYVPPSQRGARSSR